MKLLTRLLATTLTLAAVLTSVVPTQACTAFQYTVNGDLFLAKNYDFAMGEGMLLVNARGMAKQSVGVTQPMDWVSRFGSVTYNQFGREMPIGGMNEAGLIVELLWLDETQYPKPDARKELQVLQWVQYQLDTAKTVEQVIASDAAVRIVDGAGRVHFIVADPSGKVAVLELLNGTLHVFEGDKLPIPAVANDLYESCARAAAASDRKETFQPEWTGMRSLPRFQSVARHLAEQTGAPADAEDFGFAGLERVRHDT